MSKNFYACSFLKTLLLIAFIIIANLGSSKIYADTLEDVLQSPELKNVTGDTAKERKKHSRFIKAKNKNYWKLFHESGPRKLIREWIGDPDRAFELDRTAQTVSLDFLNLKSVYLVDKSIEIASSFLIPSPQNETVAKLKLMKQFSELEPPELKVLSSEKINLDIGDATLYKKEKGGCSLLIKLAKGSLLNIATDDCNNSPHLVKFAESLDLKKFNVEIEK